MMDSLEQEPVETVTAAIGGAFGVLTLNRPKALNALDQSMCVAIDRALELWAADDGIAAVLIRSTSSRAFCAGGDVRAAREDRAAWRRGESAGRLAREFFRDEYRMNRRIKRFPKPYVALIDGITMGGGVGISIHGSHRVATENTLWAMPETGIGLFPDVGMTYVLPRLPGEVGTYLGLTGARLEASDLKALGIATHVVSSTMLPDLSQALIASVSGENTQSTIERVLARYETEPTVGAVLPRQRALIDRCFAFDRVEAILDALDREPGDFAAKTAAALRTLSPTSLKATREALRRGRTLDFDACLRMEYRLSQSLTACHDFQEGVRAQLVDKDRNPKWNPPNLAMINDSMVDALFRAPAHGDLSFEA